MSCDCHVIVMCRILFPFLDGDDHDLTNVGFHRVGVADPDDYLSIGSGNFINYWLINYWFINYWLPRIPSSTSTGIHENIPNINNVVYITSC